MRRAQGSGFRVVARTSRFQGFEIGALDWGLRNTLTWCRGKGSGLGALGFGFRDWKSLCV